MVTLLIPFFLSTFLNAQPTPTPDVMVVKESESIQTMKKCSQYLTKEQTSKEQKKIMDECLKSSGFIIINNSKKK